MSSLKSNFGLLCCAAIFAAMPLSVALAGVVVASSGPSAKSYQVGRKVAPEERIVLQPGDSVTVLDERGTRVLKGGGTFTLASKAVADQSGTFAVLTRQRSAQRMRTGAVRAGDSGEVSNPNLWYLDVDKSATMCVADPGEIRLWRSTSQGDAVYRIGPDGSGAKADATFRDGEMLAAWDTAAVPVTDGSSYVVSGAQDHAATITFRILDTVPGDPEALASELIENGCMTQVEQMSHALMTGDS